MTYFYKINNEATKQIDFTQSKEMALAEGMLFETDESPEKGFDGLMYLKGFAPQAPASTYDNLRAAEYPEVTEQLDKLYHDIDGGVFGVSAKTSEFYLARKAVKDEFPKPIESE